MHFSDEEAIFLRSQKQNLQRGNWQEFIKALQIEYDDGNLPTFNIINTFVKLDIEFYSSLKQIPECIFMGCTLPENMSLKTQLIARMAFYKTSGVKHIIAPNCTDVGNKAFANSVDLETLHLDSVEVVYNNTFDDCKNLTTIYMPKLKNIYISALSNWFTYHTDKSNAQLSITVPEDFNVNESPMHRFFDDIEFDRDRIVINYV